ncbi:polysaccharide deacetylase family protein [Raoultibacter phocaeensis]|uniref:polysaccharide deacetylase family protein n=1 Tax=Raoultibacter phocaeensis TaxID=2479841 RepID=UPI00210735F2|nr:polysaccharide deacetylase family protein [Raoultibacter phocaeensis]
MSFPWKPALAALVVLVCIVGGVFFFMQSRPIAVTVNGQHIELGDGKNIEAIIQAGYATPKTGDFVAVDGEVLEAGKGEAFTAYVNSKKVDDPQTKLSAGDIVLVSDGANTMEPSQDTVETVPYEVVQEGNGPLHVIEGEGIDGSKTTKVGDISGKTFVEDIAPQNPVCRQYYPDTGGEKVIALTFDDGPWRDTTEQVLDILKENDVKATFFTVGNRIDDNGKALVKRAYDEGHQICTHTFDHASGDGKGVDLGLMSAEQQIEEVTKGYDAIREAIGADPSTVIRTPGGNFGAEVQKNLAPHISAEIGWNIDSSDWRLPGAEAIAEQLKGAWPGAVILCHDGGGDRSQTVEAIRDAIPYLKEQGYRFVTVDEMLAYPAKAEG